LLFWHISIWGLLGLFPLLFRPIELLVKVCTYVGYLALVSVLLKMPPRWAQDIEYYTFGTVFGIIVLLECTPFLGWKWEFLPLLTTSVVCATGLIGCWGTSLWLLARE
jgi:hypothetical protein